MEELRTAINAMKSAEQALAKQGFILRWNFKIRPNRGFLRDAINRLIADSSIPQKTSVIRTAPIKPERPRKVVSESKKTEQPIPEPCPETIQELAPDTDEVRPVTAFDIKAAAEYLGISYAGVFDLVKRGRLPAHGKKGTRWFKVDDLDKYLASRKKTQAISRVYP